MSKLKLNLTAPSQDGFTIVELLLAMAVFSTILVLVTIMLANIGGLFQKGVNLAKVQDAARSITADVTQNLQVSSGSPHRDGVPTATQGALCIGNTRYSFVIGKQIGPNDGTHSAHVLWRDTIQLPTACLSADLSVGNPNNINQVGKNGTELIPLRSRLISFDIEGSSPYTFKLGIAYGDDDLLCSPSDPDTCSTVDKDMTSPASPPFAYNDFLNGDLKCKGRSGDQFCATATSTTNIVQRIGS